MRYSVILYHISEREYEFRCNASPHLTRISLIFQTVLHYSVLLLFVPTAFDLLEFLILPLLQLSASATMCSLRGLANFVASKMDSSIPRRQFAKVKTLASDPFSSVNDKQPAVSDDITARIRKCLDRATHLTTPEAEAKAALRVAHKLMQRYSVQQADVYAEAVDRDNKSQISGQSGVNILSNKATVIIEI